MRPIIVLALLASLAACGGNSHPCASNADCQNGAACDAQQHVCVAGPAVTRPDVAISAPASGAIVDGTLSAAATAHAPGGVTSLSFEVRTTAGALLATAAGTASAADPASFSASVPLSGAADGSAIVQAVINYGSGQKLTSAAVQVLLDQRPPAITLQTDGRTSLLAGGQTATVTAQIGDGPGTGVVDSSVLLRIANHADVPGTGSAGIYTFSLPIDDSLSAAGTSATVPFQIVAADRLGHTATLAGDPRAVLRIDRDGPRISEIAVISDGFTKPDGTKVFDTVPLKVQATITDAAGVAQDTVCLRVPDETAPCVLGTNQGAGNVYHFDLPAPVGNFDGQSVPFTLSADDAFAAALPGAFKAEHQAVSLPQPVVYDNTPPVVTVAADSKVYARSGTIDVVATITDGTGVGAVQLVSRTAAPVTVAGNVYTFKLNAGDAPLGLDGSFPFQVVAQDNLRHSTTVGATREIDGAPPALSVQIFRTGDQAPTGTGVAYPAPLANTGWTGSTFIYSDKVHVHGTLTDRSGVGAASLHVDGTNLIGGVSGGTRLPLDLPNCAPGTTTCSFDIDVNLNDPRNGEFHSINPNLDNIPIGLDSVPAGFLQVAIDAQDTATSFSGLPAANKATLSTPVQATRLLWEQTVAGTAVTGLAIHPSGNIIVTTSGAAGDLYALAPDQPGQVWNGSAKTAAPIAISGTPAIGVAGDPSPRIYVASAAGVLYAFESDGTLAWTKDTGAPFSVGPAVAAVKTPAVDEIVVPDAAITPKGSAPITKLWRATSATDVSGVSSDEQDLLAAPIIFNAAVYFATVPGPRSSATATHVTMHPIDGEGTLGAFSNAFAGTPSAVVSGVGPFFGLVTDGVSVYAATNPPKGSGSLFAFDSALSQIWTASLALALASEPTFGADGKLYGSDVGKNTATYDLLTGAPTPFVSAIGGVAMVPLHGSGGHIYFPTSGSQALRAYKGKQLSWQLNTAANTLRYAVMDCQGRLFSAAGNTVYAFVTDDLGLADTAWPTLRRDSRNTGNAGAVKYGMRTAQGCVQ